MDGPTVETLRKSQLFSITWCEPNLSGYTLENKKEFARDLELTPQCRCSISYYDTTISRHHYSSRGFLDITLNGIDNLPEVGAGSSITIKATKDGVPPISVKEQPIDPQLRDAGVDVGGTRSWKLAWDGCCGYEHTSCRNCGRQPTKKNGIYFDMLIDFGDLTEDPIIMRPGQKNVLQHMEKLLADSHLADVTFRFPGGTELKAHSIVLAAGSPVLAAMLTQDMKESSRRVVEIKDTSAEVFQQILQFLYTGTSKEKERMAHELLVAADKYQIDSLKEECASFLAKNLTVESATKALVTAYLHSCPDLHRSTLKFVAGKRQAVCSRMEWLELMKSYPELCFQATQMMFVNGK